MKEELITMAAKILKMSEEEAAANCSEYGDSGALYINKPGRGGSSVIIESVDSFLYATSAVDPADHKKEFTNGRRSNPALFK